MQSQTLLEDIHLLTASETVSKVISVVPNKYMEANIYEAKLKNNLLYFILKLNKGIYYLCTYA